MNNCNKCHDLPIYLNYRLKLKSTRKTVDRREVIEKESGKQRKMKRLNCQGLELTKAFDYIKKCKIKEWPSERQTD